MDPFVASADVPTLLRLALALALGLFIGIERERRRKEAGLRTFAFVALMGATGGLLDDRFALLALGLLGILVVLLNVETIRTGEGAEITTSAALLLTGFAGVLAGKGLTFTPTVLGIATAGLLAWKEPLAGFSQALTGSEFRSAVLLAIIAFIVYPVLPEGSIDPWGLVAPRAAWLTVILIAALGFADYVLLRIYGARGVEITGFLGGIINSTVTVTEFATRVREFGGSFAAYAFRGTVLATMAMLVRNVAILGFLSLDAFRAALLPLAAMALGTIGGALAVSRSHPAASGGAGRGEPGPGHDAPALVAMRSPFSPVATLKFGLVFLALEVLGTLAQRGAGSIGFYAVSVAGGAVSSASAVASAASLSAAGTMPAATAATGAVLASMVSALIDLPVMARFGGDRALTRRLTIVLLIAVASGLAGVLLHWVWLLR